MIGMMYLMLTAMLALNVSGELLNAFILVDESIRDAKNTIETKNAVLYNQFGNSYESNPVKVEVKWRLAQEIKRNADALSEHIRELKELFVLTADGEKAGSTPENYKNARNPDIAAQLMITERDGARSKELKKRINEFRELLLEYIGEENEENAALRENIIQQLNTEGKRDGKNWESERFQYIPLAASMALLSQLQSSIRNMESDVVNYLYGELDAESFKFNKVEPLVIQKSDYIIAGDEYFARIMMAARDTTQPPSISVQGKNVVMDDSGVGIMRFPATSPGTFTWKGEISIKSPDGKSDRFYPIQGDYIVAQPNTVVSPVKMNVFYEGIENPIEVSVPGVASENVTIDVTNATSVKRGNQYMITPRTGTQGQRVEIKVNAKINNVNKTMGKHDFRIKRVPNPVAKVNKLTEGKIGKSLLAAQIGVEAEMEDFDFDGIKWTVTSFKVSTIQGGYLREEPSTSSLFTKQQKDLINATSRGQKVNIEEIRASGPGGATRSLNSIILTID